MDIKHARRAGYHNPCGFVTDIYKYTYTHQVIRYPFNQIAVTTEDGSPRITTSGASVNQGLQPHKNVSDNYNRLHTQLTIQKLSTERIEI